MYGRKGVGHAVAGEEAGVAGVRTLGWVGGEVKRCEACSGWGVRQAMALLSSLLAVRFYSLAVPPVPAMQRPCSAWPMRPCAHAGQARTWRERLHTQLVTIKTVTRMEAYSRGFSRCAVSEVSCSKKMQKKNAKLAMCGCPVEDHRVGLLLALHTFWSHSPSVLFL